MESLQCTELLKNSYVVIQSRPCQIQELVPAQDDNGNEVINVVGKDIFTGAEYEDTLSAGGTAQVPSVTRVEYRIVNVSDDEVNLEAIDGIAKDIQLPGGELGGQIKSAFEGGADLLATVMAALEEEAIVSYREATRGEK